METNIQHKAAVTAIVSGCAFEGDKKVPVVDFDWDAIEVEETTSGDNSRSSRQAITRLLQMISDGDATPEQIGLRVLILHHWIVGETTQDALARRMGIHKSNVSRRIREMRELCARAQLF